MTAFSRLGLIGCFVQLSVATHYYRHCHHHHHHRPSSGLRPKRAIKLSRLRARDLPADPEADMEAEQGEVVEKRVSLSLRQRSVVRGPKYLT